MVAPYNPFFRQLQSKRIDDARLANERAGVRQQQAQQQEQVQAENQRRYVEAQAIAKQQRDTTVAGNMSRAIQSATPEQKAPMYKSFLKQYGDQGGNIEGMPVEYTKELEPMLAQMSAMSPDSRASGMSNTEFSSNLRALEQAGVSEEEINKIRLDRAKTQAKGFDTLRGQSYATSTGKGQAQIEQKPLEEAAVLGVRNPALLQLQEDLQRQKAAIEQETAPELIRAKSLATEKATIENELRTMEANMPSIIANTDRLRELAQTATYSKADQAIDWTRRQAGLEPTEGSLAREEFVSIINNQVLPLLKPTFGAAFTVQEGETLKATMGDPDKSPREKMAALTAFINQKHQDIQSKQRAIGETEQPTNQEAVDLWESL